MATKSTNPLPGIIKPAGKGDTGTGAYAGPQRAGSGSAGKATNARPATKNVDFTGPGTAPDFTGAPGGAHGLDGGEQG